ncbi:hypothetical protein AYI69_g5938 [Smittium culicis]|uniref:Uncharacterized protein n=1 Tax=Smittium culicis TaxID=133412 RepID=A0A1R1Y2T6_9FUNG|nr:hypothetical protein AYI69_g5938 [Smittium culicis]
MCVRHTITAIGITKPDTGVEPVALRLKASRSTIELTGHMVSVRFELTPLSRPQLECGALDRSAKIPNMGTPRIELGTVRSSVARSPS